MNHRGNNFDVLRFALATAVIYSHSFPLTRGEEQAFEPLHWYSGAQMSIGALAVDSFFIISGFLITHSWVRGRGVVDFFRKRALRIYPGYIVTVALCLLVVAPIAGAELVRIVAPANLGRVAWKTTQLLGHVERTVFPDNPYPYALNGSLWSIRFEFACYVLTPILALLGLLSRRRWMVGVLAALLACQAVLVFIDPPAAGGMAEAGERFGNVHTLLRCMVFYFAGVVCYLYQDRLPRGAWVALAALSAFLVAALVPHGLLFVAPVALSLMIFWFAFNERIGCQNFASRGDFSYGVYLYAFPIQQLLVMYAGPWQPTTLFLAALVPTCGMAALSWYLVERPCLRLKSRPTRATAPASAAAVAELLPAAATVPALEQQS
ncbi:MAG TPA: acyltransferase [Pirellulales bacterium]|jgi:peptidoglycan/LPS O-acetylase OafA/YrhL|nr:acyltransferase [Pirellulales bacterium]